jgi:hypothetical protein
VREPLGPFLLFHGSRDGETRLSSTSLYLYAYDRSSSTLVGAKVGDPCTDEDYARIVETMVRLHAEVPPNGIAYFALIVDAGQPPPSALWRRRLALARAHGKSFRFVIVSSSILERGTVTAIHWLKPPTSEQKVISRATFAEAVAWLVSEGGSSSVLNGLYVRVREQTAQATKGGTKAGGHLR